MGLQLPGENTLIITHSPAKRKVRPSYPVSLSHEPLASKILPSVLSGCKGCSVRGRLLSVSCTRRAGTHPPRWRQSVAGSGEPFQNKDATSETRCPTVTWNLRPLSSSHHGFTDSCPKGDLLTEGVTATLRIYLWLCGGHSETPWAFVYQIPILVLLPETLTEILVLEARVPLLGSFLKQNWLS